VAKIKTQQLKTYIDFLVKNKENTRLTFESVYIDFEKGAVRMSTSRFLAEIALDFKLEPDEKPTSFWVRVDDFSRLVSEYQLLEVKDKTFTVGSDKFTFASVDEPFPVVSLIDSDSPVSIDLSEKTLEAIISASSFMSVDPESCFNGIFLKKDHVIATNQRQFYDETVEQTDMDLSLPYLLVSFITGHRLLRGQITQLGNVYRLTVDETFTLQTMVQETLEAPELDDPDFVKLFDHPNRFVLPKDGFLSILKFMDHFTSPNNNNAISILFKDEQVCFALSGEQEIERYLPLETSTPDYFKDRSLRVNQKIIQKIISFIKTGSVQVQVDFDGKGLNFTGTGDSEKKLHIVSSRLEDL